MQNLSLCACGWVGMCLQMHSCVCASAHLYECTCTSFCVYTCFCVCVCGVVFVSVYGDSVSKHVCLYVCAHPAPEVHSHTSNMCALMQLWLWVHVFVFAFDFLCVCTSCVLVCLFVCLCSCFIFGVRPHILHVCMHMNFLIS